MTLKTVAAVGLIALLFVSGVGGAVPAQAGASNAADSHADGPPDALPDPVPSFVSEIHDTIRRFLAGDLDGPLGEAVSSIAGQGGQGPGDS